MAKRFDLENLAGIRPWLGPALVLLLMAALLGADMHVRGVIRFEARYHHGNIQPEYELPVDWWVGENRVSLVKTGYTNLEGFEITPTVRLTYDPGQGRMVLVNLNSGECAVMPLDPAKADLRTDGDTR